MYDAIIVGARVAGSSTAMLLARKGYRVLLVDRATFPSDTISTHQIQIPGSIALKRWGLLDKVLATDPGAADHVRFDMGDIVLEGEYPRVDGINTVYSPRRYLLDKILIDAAVEAGAKFREGFITEELLWENEHVTGIRGRLTQGGTVAEHARIVIGADGKHSLVAKAVNAPRYDEHPVLTCGYYTYWDGVPVKGGEIYSRNSRFIGLWPTNEHKTIIFTAWPAAEFDAFRADVEGNYMATLALVPAVADRVRQGQRAERIVGSGDTPNFYRKPYGPGWALVGDAGYTKDPISAYGITDAFRDAELVAEAVDAGIAERQYLDTALAQYEARRNAESKSFYDMTVETATMAPRPAVQIELLKALEHNQEAATRFFGVLTGVVKPADFFTPPNLLRILKVQGVAKIMWSGLFARQQKRAI